MPKDAGDITEADKKEAHRRIHGGDGDEGPEASGP
jgi:hypothetical protein